MSALCPPLPPAGAARRLECRAAAAATALALLAGTVTAAAAQAPAAKRTVIRPGRLLDVRTGELRTGQAVVVEGDRIARVAPLPAKSSRRRATRRSTSRRPRCCPGSSTCTRT